jgi:hypothetical protein
VEKAVAKNQDAIRAMLEPGESILGMAYFMGDFGGDNLVVITNLRTAPMKKAAVRQEFRHGEVRKPRLAFDAQPETPRGGDLQNR